MSAPSASSRTLKVEMLARVEGEGSLTIKLKGDRVHDVKLGIFEPPRMFEAFLRGRHYAETPDIVARICGICPVAYQMCAVHAIEGLFGIEIHPQIRALRRLLYCGEWIESHALHIYMLHAPDFLGFADAIEMAGEHREAVERALRLKKIGNRLMTILGGREIHPINVAVGGFYRAPHRAELDAITAELKWALDAAHQTVRLAAGFEFPDFEQEYEFVALRHADEYPLNEGRIVSSAGLDIDAAHWNECFVEQHVKHSNALHARVRERGSYLVGPLARFALNYDRLTPEARQAAAGVGLTAPERNPFRSIVVRAVELVFACEEALRLIAEYDPPPRPRAEAAPRAGVGHSATEAPRGILYHRYEFDSAGMVVKAQIVPPTSQNQKRIEDDLWNFVPRFAHLSNEELTLRCEQAVRNYDPCISCATHALRVRVCRS